MIQEGIFFLICNQNFAFCSLSSLFFIFLSWEEAGSVLLHELATVSSEKCPEATAARLPQSFLAHHAWQPASVPSDGSALAQTLCVFPDLGITHHLIWKLRWRRMQIFLSGSVFLTCNCDRVPVACEYLCQYLRIAAWSTWDLFKNLCLSSVIKRKTRYYLPLEVWCQDNNKLTVFQGWLFLTVLKDGRQLDMSKICRGNVWE